MLMSKEKRYSNPKQPALNLTNQIFSIHEGGKIGIQAKTKISTAMELGMVYTPGVARVCEEIVRKPEAAFQYTIKRNSVVIVTDGTSVLGLGDVGPLAAAPVMEGKALLFKELAGVDAWPICLDTKDPDEIVQIVKGIAPIFGGINLEDISAPRCFEIEQTLKKKLTIPVFHDDQHGTAIVVVAALMNALKIVGKNLSNLKVVVSGVGAAGMACSKLLMQKGVRYVIGCDRAGAIYRGRNVAMTSTKHVYAHFTNPNNERGNIRDVIRGADVFIGLSGPGVLTAEQIRQMAPDPIVFALANPEPEIMPDEARRYSRIVATGSSDYPNQINNALVFPGVFRGLLDCRARTINDEMKQAAASALAALVTEEELQHGCIIPSIFNNAVVPAIAEAVKQAAWMSGAADRQ
jgi:malate dehydrogenase (oxaloacetate-decarboxylating)